MEDSKSASLILIAGAVGVGYWFYHLSQGKLAPAAADTTTGPNLQPNSVTMGSPLARLEAFAQAWNLPITSTTGGQHAPNSLHYQGRAEDVSVRGLTQQAIDAIKAAAAAAGIHVLDERYTGNGPYGPSSGPHLHLSIPVSPGGPY